MPLSSAGELYVITKLLGAATRPTVKENNVLCYISTSPTLFIEIKEKLV
jgi:hypothetical protein